MAWADGSRDKPHIFSLGTQLLLLFQRHLPISETFPSEIPTSKSSEMRPKHALFGDAEGCLNSAHPHCLSSTAEKGRGAHLELLLAELCWGYPEEDAIPAGSSQLGSFTPVQC